MTQTRDPNWMTFDTPMTEVAGILATGILRRRKREMNQISKDRGENNCDSRPLPEGGTR